MQTTYFTTPPTMVIPPPATIHAPPPQQPQPYQKQYNAGKIRRKGKNEEPGGVAPTTIGNVPNHMAQTNNHMEVAVEEEEYQQNPTTTINPAEVAEEAQMPTSGTMAEE